MRGANKGERRQQADVAFTKTFGIRDLGETGNALEPEVFDPSAGPGDGGEQNIAAVGLHSGPGGGFMRDALHGQEARSRPGEHERNRCGLAGSQLVTAGFRRLGRALRHQADLHGLRFAMTAIDIVLDQVALRRGGRKLR